MTKQREIIYEIIINSPRHLTAEEIFLLAKEGMPSIAFGTVYRNLGIMVESGDIGKVELVGEPARYDKNSMPHCHIRCVKCGKIDDIKIDGIKEFLDKRVQNVVGYHLNINYICDTCKRRDGALPMC